MVHHLLFAVKRYWVNTRVKIPGISICTGWYINYCVYQRYLFELAGLPITSVSCWNPFLVCENFGIHQHVSKGKQEKTMTIYHLPSLKLT